MPLPIPNLDDRTFNDLTTEAVGLIPRNLPQWTDYNPSDPGITLMELFAFVIEAGFYQINRIPDRTLLNFSAFVGVTPASGEAVQQTLQRALAAAAYRTNIVTAAEFERLALQTGVLQTTVQSVTGTALTVSAYNTTLAYPVGTRVTGPGGATDTLATAIGANTAGVTKLVVSDTTFASGLHAGDVVSIVPIVRARALVSDGSTVATVQSVDGAILTVSVLNTPLAYPAGTRVTGPDGTTDTLAAAIPPNTNGATQIVVTHPSFASGLKAGDVVSIPPTPDAYPPDEFMYVIVVPATAPNAAGVDLRQAAFELLRASCLIATDVKVREASYAPLSVVASVVADGTSHLNNAEIQANVINALTAFLDPLAGGSAGTGWPFGRSIFRSELYQVIQAIKGVDYVRELLLNGDALIAELPLPSADSLVSLAAGSPQVTVAST